MNRYGFGELNNLRRTAISSSSNMRVVSSNRYY